jgi:hypothetical protein
VVAGERRRSNNNCGRCRNGSRRRCARHRGRDCSWGFAAQPNVGVDSDANGVDGSAYFVDTLFRSAKPRDEGNVSESHAEAMRILSRSFQNGNVALAPADAQYLAQMVAERTGLSPADAQQRVDSVVNQLNDAQQKLRQMADTARKQAARVSTASALAMLIGAFIASAAAALGGRIRDEY